MNQMFMIDEPAVKESSKRKRITIRLLLIVAALLICAAAVYILYKAGAFLPGWAEWKEKTEVVRMEDDSIKTDEGTEGALVGGSTADKAVVKNRKFTLTTSEGKVLWSPDKGNLVQDFIIGDIDHDDQNEVALLVWKIGSYGRYKPIWVEEDEKTWSQHIFIYDYDETRGDRLKPIWMSSRMGVKAADFYLDEDERLHIIDPEGEETIWVWAGWGLMLVE